MLTSNKTITIIGAGLVGSLTAIYLGKRGYKVNVYDQLPDIRKESISAGRSINLALANRGIRPLKELNIMDKVEKLLIPMKGRMIHNPEGELQFQSYGQKPNEVIYSVSRGGLVSLLRDEAENTNNVNFHFKKQLKSIDIEKSTLSFEDLSISKNETANYQILLAADGAGSRVRRALEESGHTGFSAELLEHSYKELEIPVGDINKFQIEKEALHIWPRGQFMLIALPNIDGSFTLTLFMPNHGEISFENLKTKLDVDEFFETYFKDVKPLIPELQLDYFNNPTGVMGTVRCDKWDFESIGLIGDSAHAIVPFHGQGMNCGFEDCRELNRLLDKYSDDWSTILPALTSARKHNANAIADMALENYIEMRDSVRDPQFHLKKAVAFELEKRFPQYFIPRYSMVMFHHIPYFEAQKRGELQAEILNKITTNKSNLKEIDFSESEKIVTSMLTKLTKKQLI